MNDYHAFKSTGGGSGGGSGGFGCGWVVIVLVVYMLIAFLAEGASADAIDCLLAWGVIVFFFAKSIF